MKKGIGAAALGAATLAISWCSSGRVSPRTRSTSRPPRTRLSRASWSKRRIRRPTTS